MITQIHNRMPQVLCRNEQMENLMGLLGNSPLDEPPPCVLVQGDAGTGKTLVVTECLTGGGFKHATVNCMEAYSLKLIYQQILDQLSGHVMTAANGYQSYSKCAYFIEFVTELKNLSERLNIARQDVESESWVIVLDKCEYLRTLGRNVLPGFVKLRELSGLKVCIILVSTLSWHRFHVADNNAEPIMLHLPQYTQKQVLTILQRYKPEGFTDKFYDNYLNLVLSIFYQACRDLRELKHQATVNFANFTEPILKGEATEADAAMLWRKAQPFFKKSLRCLYLRTDPELAATEKLTSVATHALGFELPFYSKYLLLGAYIASFNPASSDKRLFVKHHGSVKKSAKVKVSAPKHHLVGPKPFGLQRLFAIVSAILDDEKFNLNADLFVEVASLVQLNLLTQISEDVLDAPTFKCNVGLPFIDVIAKNVQFPIRNYLVDFMDS